MPSSKLGSPSSSRQLSTLAFSVASNAPDKHALASTMSMRGDKAGLYEAFVSLLKNQCGHAAISRPPIYWSKGGVIAGAVVKDVSLTCCRNGFTAAHFVQDMQFGRSEPSAWTCPLPNVQWARAFACI